MEKSQPIAVSRADLPAHTWARRGLCATLAGLVGLLAVLVAQQRPAVSAAAAPAACGPAWRVVPSASAGPTNHMRAVAAVSAADVWAVGEFAPDPSNTTHPLAEHWNGTAWTQVPVANPAGAGRNELDDIAARTSADLWAVGTFSTPSGNAPLTEHWTGSAWSQVLAAVPSGSPNSTLHGVALLSATDIWAVGDFIDLTNNARSEPLAEHWNGAAWTIVPTPPAGSSEGQLLAVAAVSANDVWAVGRFSGIGPTPPLIMHWNGQTWSLVPAVVPTNGSTLTRLAVISATDVWAVGSVSGGSGSQVLIEHWDGHGWTAVAGANPGSSGNALNGVVARSATDIWAVGARQDAAAAAQTLVEHWDGSAWSPVASPSPGSQSNSLNAIAAVSAADLWAVGSSSPGSGLDFTLAERYNDPCQGTVTATPTGVRATHTPTPIPATPTRAASPTPCTAGQFRDVHPSDYFATPVAYLVSHGVVSGYGDCTFRPYNNTTRAQMVKIVVLGFSKPIVTPAGGNNTFTDVPATFPFFSVIETAAAAGIVSGYTCGRPGEPCDPQQRPYFRPNANVTRAQLSKIDVLAAGWALVTPPAPGSFADVLPGTAFYPFVETASAHGVVSGYACGGPGEPCDAGRRPYFRPANPATRGQIAKIVYLSLTAGAAGPATPH